MQPMQLHVAAQCGQHCLITLYCLQPGYRLSSIQEHPIETKETGAGANNLASGMCVATLLKVGGDATTFW